VKVLAPGLQASPRWPSSEAPGDPWWWRREADLYASGLFDSLEGGLRAARGHDVVERSDGSVALVLEDVGRRLRDGQVRRGPRTCGAAMFDLFVDSRHARELYELVAREYLGGLRDVDRSGDQAVVRLGIALSAVVKYAWTAPALLSGRWGPPEAFEQRRRVLELLDELAAEARALRV
jgi:hypothetical protein